MLWVAYRLHMSENKLIGMKNGGKPQIARENYIMRSIIIKFFFFFTMAQQPYWDKAFSLLRIYD
jgi:hypothetical protein